jgi:ParB-like nuclease domain
VLVELNGQWPPILVRPEDMAVVDGHHRLEAARRLGMKFIAGRIFRGSAEDSFIEAVRSNTQHGLPLLLPERKKAAGQILVHHSEWSDRRIASLCGLSAGTVGCMRAMSKQAANLGVESGHLDSRVGRDGRRRPTDPDAARQRIAEVVRKSPGLSLRSVAKIVGVSPETVRSVRGRVEDTLTAESCGETVVPEVFRSTSSGQAFFAWLTDTEVNWPDDLVRIASVPQELAEEVSSSAKRRAQLWAEFADRLEARATSGQTAAQVNSSTVIALSG